jgi:hypothetical protein
MIDERALQDLRASFEASWLKHATDAELALLQLSAERPELFEVPDDGSIHVLLDPSISSEEMVVSSPTATPQASENAAALVFHRTRLRARHGLPQADCAQPPRYGRGTCTCLTRVLDSLGDVEAVEREEVLKAARKLHKRSVPRLRVRKRTPKAEAPAPASLLEPPLEPLTETSTRPALKQRVRRSHGPPDPLSYAAFKRGRSGPSIRDIIDGKF